MQMEFLIEHTWDGSPVNHDPIKIVFSPDQSGMKIEVVGPFFNDPAGPPGAPGQPFPELWEFEVVESFFLDSSTENYLEVELCPHGQHLILLLSGVRQAFLQQLPMKYNTTITGSRWMGEALVPWSYFPPNVDKMNSYSIHGSGENRTYEALYPIPKEEIVDGQQPNFHRLEYFKDFHLQKFIEEGWIDPATNLWKEKILNPPPGPKHMHTQKRTQLQENITTCAQEPFQLMEDNFRPENLFQVGADC